ncbi:MAG: hypothetical protein K9H25_20220 [Rhodospirillum sp.]|nr:hypothetical protein [Rhodospirillum sp.]MCF8491505.1 hypothetical protein [Rhodospirillum sp.]
MPGRTGVLGALAGDPEIRRRIAEKVTLEVETGATLKRALRAGLGVSLQSRAILGVEEDGGDGTDSGTGTGTGKDLLVRPIVSPTLTRRLYLVSSRMRLPSRAVAETKAVLLDIIRVVNQDGRWPGRFVESDLISR